MLFLTVVLRCYNEMKYQILQQNVLRSGVSKHIVLVTSDAFYMLKKATASGSELPLDPAGG